jgi:hypothetical protein
LPLFGTLLFLRFHNIFDVLESYITSVLQMKMQTEMQTKKDRDISPCPDFYSSWFTLLYCAVEMPMIAPRQAQKPAEIFDTMSEYPQPNTPSQIQ